MIKHVVLLKWNEAITDEAIKHIGQELHRLQQDIGQIRRFEFGPDQAFYKGNADYALIAEFDSQETLHEYVVHPRHREFLQEVTGPYLDSFTACQFVVE